MSAKHSILIVEGSRTQAERLRLILQSHDYSVTMATSGSEALEAARRHPPALIITGVALSGMDGYDMCAALKQDEMLKHIPVVLLTALSDVDDLMRGLQARVDYCIAKPYHEEDLLTRIAAIMAGLVRQTGPPGREQLEVLLRGERKMIASDRQQLLRLLLSTYENYSAVLRQNRFLSTEQLQLKTQNQHLQEECDRLRVTMQNSSHAAPPVAAPPAVAAREPEASAEKRMLVADDTAICRTLLARLLGKFGYVADVVTNGAEALEAYQRRRYAAVFMDVHTPHGEGLEATMRIRQQEKKSGDHVPIIAMTAHAHPHERERCVSAGMDDYLLKPITLEALRQVLARRLSQSLLSTAINAPGAAPSSWPTEGAE